MSAGGKKEDVREGGGHQIVPAETLGRSEVVGASAVAYDEVQLAGIQEQAKVWLEKAYMAWAEAGRTANASLVADVLSPDLLAAFSVKCEWAKSHGVVKRAIRCDGLSGVDVVASYDRDRNSFIASIHFLASGETGSVELGGDNAGKVMPGKFDVAGEWREFWVGELVLDSADVDEVCDQCGAKLGVVIARCTYCGTLTHNFESWRAITTESWS